jgi:hypothetical protein
MLRVTGVIQAIRSISKYLAMLCRWEHEDEGLGHLVPECSHTGHVLALYVDTRGDFIVVGKRHSGYHLVIK